MRLTILASVSLFLSACAPAAQAPVPASAVQSKPVPVRPEPRVPRTDLPDDDFEIRLQRSGCGFACPAYSLSITTDGAVLYQGSSHVKALGERRGQADSTRLAALRETLRVEFPALAGSYTPQDKSCGRWATDQASVTLAVSIDGRRYESRHYLGCSGAPKRLGAIEKLVDDAANSGEWVRGEAMY